MEEITKVTNNIRVDNMKLFSFKFKEKKRKKKKQVWTINIKFGWFELVRVMETRYMYVF